MLCRLFCAVVFLSLSGCIHPLVSDSTKEIGEIKEYKRTHWMWGLGVSSIDVQCPNGIKFIEQGKSIGDSFLTSITMGIWQRSTGKVTCAK